jgi:ATP-dependent DNA helicase RecG
MEKERLKDIIHQLITLPHETEWVEFKHNHTIPHEIGEYISAISNACILHGKAWGYILWGIEDGSHNIVGTSFQPRKQKKGNQELESWLLGLLDPGIEIRIHEEEIDGQRIVLFEVQAAYIRPVRFNGVEYIRVGSYKKKLHDFPEKERALWRLFDKVSFEKGIAKGSVTSDEVLALIDYPNYFQLLQQSLPDNKNAILKRLISEGIIQVIAKDRYDITNICAILFAKNLEDFGSLVRKALRIIVYQGDNRVKTIKEHKVEKGYAIGFKDTIEYINDQLPQNEEIGEVFRRDVRMYPEIAVRELVANALIHQDFSITGAGPMVEIFTNRVEITNPGIPLIDTLRFIDEPPRSRNEMLASLMRRMNICEERGSGIDKVIFEIELYQLPPPDFRVTGASMIASLYKYADFAKMSKEEKIRACYQHACLQYVSNRQMSNSSLRVRFGIVESNYPMASRLIKVALQEKWIKSSGEGSRKNARYVPFWA